MKPPFRLIFAAVVVLALTAWAALAVQAQGGYGERYFAETGYWVRGEFLAFFDRYGGVLIFGLPRSGEVYQDGLRVQYFQRARMEYHPNNPEPYKVQLTLLGDLLNYRMPGIPASAIPAMNNPQRRYYPQTGHTLSYTFLQYFESHGALDVFGYPITEFVAERGTIVQYFQRSKMEWHPENAVTSQVTLGNLGDEYIARFGVPRSTQAPTSSLPQPTVQSSQLSTVPTQPGPSEATRATPIPVQQPTLVLPVQGVIGNLRVSASVRYPITGQGGSQTVFVRATDEVGQPVPNAAVEVVVHFRGGDQVYQAPNTDVTGSTSLTFGIGYPPPGYTVAIDVRASYGGRMVSARTSFIPWW